MSLIDKCLCGASKRICLSGLTARERRELGILPLKSWRDGRPTTEAAHALMGPDDDQGWLSASSWDCDHIHALAERMPPFGRRSRRSRLRTSSATRSNCKLVYGGLVATEPKTGIGNIHGCKSQKICNKRGVSDTPRGLAVTKYCRITHYFARTFAPEATAQNP